MQKIIIEEIPKFSKHDNLALILFGSYSRGDFDSQSDIDVLEVTIEIEKPYSSNEINFSTYSLEQLMAMAKEGNLFILHIISDGKVISGDKKILDILKTTYKKQENYKTFRNEIILTSNVLDLTEEQYNLNPKGYYGLLCYLFRSYLYSDMYDEDCLTFSIKEISKRYKDNQILEVFQLKHKKNVTYSEFMFCKNVFQKYTKTKFINHYIDSIDLVRGLKESTKFGFSIALHFLVDLADELYS